MTWLLVIIAYAVGGMPAEYVDPPAHVGSMKTLAECHRQARAMADYLSRATEAPVTFIYECKIEEASGS